MYISMLSFNSDILQSTFPVNVVLDALGYNYLKFFFQIILFGTFIETGASLIHGLNQRVFDTFSGVSAGFVIPSRTTSLDLQNEFISTNLFTQM